MVQLASSPSEYRLPSFCLGRSLAKKVPQPDEKWAGPGHRTTCLAPVYHLFPTFQEVLATLLMLLASRAANRSKGEQNPLRSSEVGPCLHEGRGSVSVGEKNTGMSTQFQK